MAGPGLNGAEPDTDRRVGGGAGRASWARVLLLLPFAGILSVPFYNSVEPSWLAVPFFYWYQMLWIVLCAVVISIVYLIER